YPHDTRMLSLSEWLIEYPFAERVYPRAFDVVAAVRDRARPVILSDGDVVFQPRKVARSGLWAAFAGDVLIYIHKERELGDVELRYPADRYVLVDDKLRIRTTVKQLWSERVTTVFVRQGHYALDAGVERRYPPADISVDSIGGLLDTLEVA